MIDQIFNRIQWILFLCSLIDGIEWDIRVCEESGFPRNRRVSYGERSQCVPSK